MAPESSLNRPTTRFDYEKHPLPFSPQFPVMMTALRALLDIDETIFVGGGGKKRRDLVSANLIEINSALRCFGTEFEFDFELPTGSKRYGTARQQTFRYIDLQLGPIPLPDTEGTGAIELAPSYPRGDGTDLYALGKNVTIRFPGEDRSRRIIAGQTERSEGELYQRVEGIPTLISDSTLVIFHEFLVELNASLHRGKVPQPPRSELYPKRVF